MISVNGKGQRFSSTVPSYDMTQWGVILAGGDGTRLRSLTRRITGDDRPKQFCPIFDDESLLDRTRRRVARTVAPERIVAVLTKAHERFYAPLIREVPSRLLVLQPENRGTSPAILYSLLRIVKMAPTASVALFPSDHYASDDETFMAHVRVAFDGVLKRPELVTLLGISPASPETAYGWIEPDQQIFGNGWPAFFRVRRFWEKPKPALARALLAAGCLWNSFVMVARGATLLALIESAAPNLYHTFLGLWPVLNTDDEEAAIATLYAGLPSTNFSEQVLAGRPEDLAVLTVGGVHWSDLGEPDRVLSVLAQRGVNRAMAPALISA